MPMRYLLAVSGGIDSVVLLDMLVRTKEHELIVAHFDHGVRPDSASDARFVQELAAAYSVPFVMHREELGSKASEELARSRRYAFLRSEAKKHEAVIVTAHHGDDCIETICINATRGTGWRGLAVLDSKLVRRPLLSFTKSDLWAYALDHRLEWVEDSTNSEDAYLRNRLRRVIALHLPPENRSALLDLWRRQKELKQAIDKEAADFIQPFNEYSRYLFITIDELSAGELLRGAIVARTQASPTRPQIERALVAIKTARAGSSFELGAGVTLLFKRGTFIVKTP